MSTPAAQGLLQRTNSASKLIRLDSGPAAGADATDSIRRTPPLVRARSSSIHGRASIDIPQAGARANGAAAAQPPMGQADFRESLRQGVDKLHGLLERDGPCVKGCGPEELEMLSQGPISGETPEAAEKRTAARKAVNSFAREVTLLAATLQNHEALRGTTGLGADGLLRNLPQRLNQLVAARNFPVDALTGQELHLFCRALARLGATEAMRNCMLQLQDKHAQHLGDFLRKLSQESWGAAKVDLDKTRQLCDTLVTVHGLQDGRQLEQFRKDLMTDSLQRRYLAVSPKIRNEVRAADARSLQYVLPKPEEGEDGHALLGDVEVREPLDPVTTAELQGLLGVVSPSKVHMVDSTGFHYTAWGTPESLGSVVDKALRHTLSTPLRALGNWVQGGYDSGARYVAGALIKGAGNALGAAAGLAGGAVSFIETTVRNTVEVTLRVVGAATLSLAGLGAKIVGLASPAAAQKGSGLLQSAKGMVGNTSFVRKAPQDPISPALAVRATELGMLARFTGTTSKSVREQGMPSNFSFLKREHIPDSILARRLGDSATGTVAKLKFDAHNGLLIGDWSNHLKIGVYTENVPGRTHPKIILTFVGTQMGRPATLKSNLAQGVGIEDTAYNEAAAVVEAFVARHGAENIELVGHSLGGGLATYAGIKHRVKVTGFNSAGLHLHLRNRLGARLIEAANVDHFNTARDPLSQGAEHGIFGLTAGKQVGRSHLIPDGGHSLPQIVAQLQKL